jgi:ribosomal 30S subunit maturation factor RimM
MIDQIVEIGKIGKPEGILGFIRLDIDLMYEKSVLKSPYLFLYLDGLPVPFKILEVKNDKNLQVKLDDIDSPEKVSEYTHTVIGLHEKHILGTRKIGVKGIKKYVGYKVMVQNEYIGTIKEINMFPAQVMASLANENGKEFYLPLVDEWILSVLPDSKILEMNLPEGLLDVI